MSVLPRTKVHDRPFSAFMTERCPRASPRMASNALFWCELQFSNGLKRRMERAPGGGIVRGMLPFPLVGEPFQGTRGESIW
eukprot:8402587-Pyramimonas_sp.AAC.1